MSNLSHESNSIPSMPGKVLHRSILREAGAPLITGAVFSTGISGQMPTDAAARKAIPIYSGFMKYFPKAMAAVAELSRVGNDQHNPGQPLHWDRSKSGDELDACMRHMLEAGTIDIDGIRHSTKGAWRAMANLEKELEAADAQAPS